MIPQSPEERQRHILEHLASGSVTVPSLAAALRVSAITIRRDLAELERAGKLLRVHGGAMANAKVAYEFSFKEREARRREAKEAIARAAAARVEPGTAVFLDTGTTTLAVARALRAVRPGVIVTINLGVAAEYVGQRDVRVLVAGGELSPMSPDLYGEWTIDTLSRVSVDIGFFGCDGIDPAEGFYAADTRSAAVSRLMLSRCRQAFLVADSSKFGRRSMCTIAPLGALAGVITDSELPAPARRNLQKHGVSVIVASIGKGMEHG